MGELLAYVGRVCCWLSTADLGCRWWRNENKSEVEKLDGQCNQKWNSNTINNNGIIHYNTHKVNKAFVFLFKSECTENANTKVR